MKEKRYIVAVLAVLVYVVAGGAEPKVHQEGRIRVVYYTEGRDAVLPDDKNGNGVPDHVEDVLTQTVAARLLFVEVLGFPDPVETRRFRAAGCVDIRFKSKDSGIGNGLAFDELQSARRVPGDPEDARCIAFNVVATLDPKKNGTPSHEYFHLIQYSVSYFKNSWYAEGMARWSERGLGAGALGTAEPLAAWPLPPDRAAEIFAMSYNASASFWNPLAARHGADSALPAGPALDKLQVMKYTDGTPVLNDLAFTGWRFMRDVLLELGKADETAFREQAYDRWSEANQFSPKNNAYILRAVEAVAARHGRTDQTDQLPR